MSKPIGRLQDTTVHDIHRSVCSDYLRYLADLIENGKIVAFDIEWDLTSKKPVGKLAASTDVLKGPSEHELDTRITEYREEQVELAKAIAVVDVSQKLQDHEPCDDDEKEECPLCNTSLS